ncbi:cytochrome P450 [Amycolatopsis sp. CA-230715]|uniref:cytochrome P450 n=1 Tax=Amycolatopsis sp. CA-230715 TaxID=2745196 RepID=UPI001C01F30D|nr:cytochrome P450 [Amycolatopsis sp. CA-230715]QWF84819.1 Biotin biosynthesis cytochrome P450 [Amycolatopsis sp. CA-230715]
MAVGVLPRFDPSDPAVFGDPYPAYAQLRAAGPLARGLGGQWVLSGHAEISAVSRDRRMTKLLPPGYYESLMGIGPASAFLIRMQELFHNRAVTRLLGRAFTGRFTPQLTEHALTVARGLLAPAARDGRFDAVRDVGVPLPVEVVCELFGVPERDRELFRTSVAAMVAAFNDSVLTADPEVLAARRAAADAGVTALRACLAPLVDRARSEKGTDVLSVLASHLGDDGDPLADDVVIDSVIMSCYAGFETAMAMITTGLAVLAGKPGEWAKLRARPDLVPTAVEEFVRYDAPIQIGVRRVLETVEIGGRSIRPGRLLVLLLGSANRDERVFQRPSELDVTRSPNPHVAYGGGAYACLGAALARLEGAVVLRAMLEAFTAIAPGGPPVRLPRFNFRTYSSVPLEVTAAAGWSS